MQEHVHWCDSIVKTLVVSSLILLFVLIILNYNLNVRDTGGSP